MYSSTANLDVEAIKVCRIFPALVVFSEVVVVVVPDHFKVEIEKDKGDDGDDEERSWTEKTLGEGLVECLVGEADRLDSEDPEETEEGRGCGCGCGRRDLSCSKTKKTKHCLCPAV